VGPRGGREAVYSTRLLAGRQDFLCPFDGRPSSFGGRLDRGVNFAIYSREKAYSKFSFLKKYSLQRRPIGHDVCAEGGGAGPVNGMKK